MFTQLKSLATVSLGYKSLQNNFFYVNQATIDTYGIEKTYLVPILMLGDLNASVFEQNPKPSLWLFACRETRKDLHGTGALRYIDAMSHRSAADKKQTGKNLTIKEALEAQSGGNWYAPKARPNKHHVWLRKAFNAVYAPFLFDKRALVDQRLNSVSPVDGIDWREIAAVLTSSLFTYSLEINGAAAMGAGALEAPTTKLRDYPVLDVTKLKPKDREDLISRAELVWGKEEPLDWSSENWKPGTKLHALDEWMLKAAGRNISIDKMYGDIRATCLARIAVAADKGRKMKRREADSIGSVADSITKDLAPMIQSKNFPNDFLDGASLDLPLSFDRKNLKEISMSLFLDSCEIHVRTKAGDTAYKSTQARSVAEAIVRALLLGRSQFSVSTNRKAMDNAVNRFLDWFAQTDARIEQAISESALGTGYEDALKREVYARLGIHPLVGAKTLPSEISL